MLLPQPVISLVCVCVCVCLCVKRERERERESQRHAFRGGNLSLFVFSPFLLLLLLFFCASTACRRLRHRRAQPARLQLPVVPQTGGGESTCRRAERTHLGMDALKSAGRAIIKSPGVPRHTWGTSKHESEWSDVCVCWRCLGCGTVLWGAPTEGDQDSVCLRLCAPSWRTVVCVGARWWSSFWQSPISGGNAFYTL